MLRGGFLIAMACFALSYAGPITGPLPDESQGLQGEFIDQTVPRALYPAKPFVVSIRIKNTGSDAWDGDSVILMPADLSIGKTWGIERIKLVANKSVAPGEVGTFTAKINSPSLIGVRAFQWKLFDELRGPFPGQSDRVSIRIVAPTWLADVYRDLIGREPKPADQRQFLGMLQKDPDLHQYLVHLLLKSERADKIVQEAFRKFMGRRATVKETAYWKKHLPEVGVNGLRRELALTDKCFQNFGGSNYKYVAEVHQAFSGQQPGSDELETVVQGLKTPTDREALVDRLLNSAEARIALVTEWYQELFPQNPKDDIEKWTAQLNRTGPKAPLAEDVLASFYETYSQPASATRSLASH